MYYQCIRSCPLTLLILTFGISLGLFCFTIYRATLPTFDDPLIGFEVRGSEISNRLNTWRLLSESTSWNGLLSLYPKDLTNKFSNQAIATANTTTTTIPTITNNNNNNSESVISVKSTNDSNSSSDGVNSSKQNQHKRRRKGGKNKQKNNKNGKSKTTTKQQQQSNITSITNGQSNKEQQSFDPYHSKTHLMNNNNQNGAYFCGKLFEEYVHFVVERDDGGNLLQVESLQHICKLDQLVLRMQHITTATSPSTPSSINQTVINDNHNNHNNNNNKSAQWHFGNYCETKLSQDHCCPSWSVSNYIMLLNNKTACDTITNDDVNTFVRRLQQCASFYTDNYLNENCATDPRSYCPNVPEHCYQPDNMVFNVFHYLVDYRFLRVDQRIMKGNESGNLEVVSKHQMTSSDHNNGTIHLQATSIFLPVAKSSELIAYFDAIRNIHADDDNGSGGGGNTDQMAYGTVRVVAADLGLKHRLFGQSLIADLVLVLFASGIIFGCLLLYTRSLLLTITAMLTNVASLGSAYFFYKIVLDIKFFPFLNLLSAILLIGIGSDNALIYCKAYNCVSVYLDKNGSGGSSAKVTNNNRRHSEFHQQISDAMWHVFLSCFCASLTTCCAFFAGYYSNITSLKCFSIFAGTSIITNFIITIITFPSAIILSEQSSQLCSKMCRTKSDTKMQQQSRFLMDCRMDDLSNWLFNKFIVKLVFNHRYPLLVVLSSISIGASILLFYKPGLQLPTTQEFQVFSSDHLFERYDSKYRKEFWFFRYDPHRDASAAATATVVDNDSIQNGQSNPLPANTNDGSTQTELSVVLPIRVVFGVLPIDNGNPMNPFDRGNLVFDSNFTIASPDAQVWLLEFCRDLRLQPFYRPTMGPLLTNCFIETFKSWMEERRCVEIVGDKTLDRFPCCEQSVFPYEPNVFEQCLSEVTELLHKTPNYMFAMNRAGPRFEANNRGTVKAIVIEYDSIFDAYTTSYQAMSAIWQTLDGWISQQLKTAPRGLRNGWFVTVNTDFFALQLSLSSGMQQSLLIAMTFAFITLVVTTWNLRLALLSSISIACIIFTTIGTLVLLGWKLNVIESITISLTIGLAIDATLHYTIAYKLLAKGNRLLGLQMTLVRIGSPVAMGALTTLLAGFVMIFSCILAYIQIGTFMMLLAITSWTFSTLFHLSLISIFGAHNEPTTIVPTLKRLGTLTASMRKSFAPKAKNGTKCKLSYIVRGSGGDRGVNNPNHTSPIEKWHRMAASSSSSSSLSIKNNHRTTSDSTDTPTTVQWPLSSSSSSSSSLSTKKYTTTNAMQDKWNSSKTTMEEPIYIRVTSI